MSTNEPHDSHQLGRNIAGQRQRQSFGTLQVPAPALAPWGLIRNGRLPEIRPSE